MKYRLANLCDEESIATAGTKTIELDGIDAISRIVIAARGTNNGSTPTAHPAKMVSKIEVVDGSDTIFSLSGVEARALAEYDEGVAPFSVNETEDGVTCQANYHIDFGRVLMDKNLALVPSKFDNPQLKITHNKASGGSAPDAGTLGVYAYIFDDVQPNPMGFLQSKEIKSWTAVASTTETTELPTDYPIRKLLLQSLIAGTSPLSQINRISLHENNKSKMVINNERAREYVKSMYPGRTTVDYIGTLGTGSAVTYYCMPTYEVYYTGVGRSASQTTMIVSQGSGGSVSITNDSSESIQVICEGKLPHGAVCIPFGDQNDLMDWYDVTKLKRLNIDITSGSSIGSSSTVEYIVQQLRRY